MPGIAIDVDGIRLATMDCATLELAHFSVHGNLCHEDVAVLHADGANFSNGGCGYMSWLEESLLPGQLVTVRFLDDVGIGDRGKTITEMFPDHEPCEEFDFTINAELAAKLRAEPRLRDRFSIELDTSVGKFLQVQSAGNHASFAFDLGWEHGRPHKARVSLRTYGVEDVIARTLGTIFLETTFSAGNSATFKLLY